VSTCTMLCCLQCCVFIDFVTSTGKILSDGEEMADFSTDHGNHILRITYEWFPDDFKRYTSKH